MAVILMCHMCNFNFTNEVIAPSTDVSLSIKLFFTFT